ncbi:Smr/MutS family protein [Deltaproteobacteria bacterium]|nr:Smr/MutS family protein [Deltaproteobacteria bacterium]
MTLKTLGLLSLMAQSGLHIPAEEGSQLPVFKNVLAAIGDEQDIQAGQSTFSAHVTHLKYMIEHADRESLIIIDEPGMGTDPNEGAAFAMALLDDLARRDVPVVVSTHYSRLKTYGLLEKRAINASMEFDDTAGRPTFSLRYGTPGTSYAFEVALNQGIGQDLLTRARGYLDQDEVRLNRLIDKLNRLRHETNLEKSEAQNVRRKYHSAKEKLLETLERVEFDRKEILEEKKDEANQLIKEAREEFKILINSFKGKKEPSQAFVQKRYDEIAGRLSGKLLSPENEEGTVQDKGLKTGQLVRHRNLNLEGKILSMDSLNSKALISTGNVRISVGIRDLMSVSGRDGSEPEELSGGLLHRFSERSAKEINLIGYRVEEALSLIDRIIDRSMIEGDMSIRIVHGHGTGKLKSAIRDHLKNLSCVKKIGGEDPRYGGEAITIVELN